MKNLTLEKLDKAKTITPQLKTRLRRLIKNYEWKLEVMRRITQKPVEKKT